MNSSSQEHFILLLVTSHDLPAYTVPFKEHSISRKLKSKIKKKSLDFSCDTAGIVETELL